MLQRTSLLEKRKKKKNEFDKMLQTTRTKIELDMKQQNKKADDDFVDLNQLDARVVKFEVTDDLKNIIPTLLKYLQEYVSVNNEYINIKGLEEKLKAKK